ncbi:hypothetical protein C8R21_11314 [Nitrosospira multiformis]|uniref:Uncharacterized protein n=1 Tax=Nitrosospira multiformis TaxID=1231 RepID=A0A2T5IAJ3_9PROT|nr:hypothetical protein C8R21_11314 [Nitrosospira multiformis]
MKRVVQCGVPPKEPSEQILCRARCCQNRDDHEARDEGRSLDYDAKKRNEVAL